MKLIFCKSCEDVVRLVTINSRFCRCGKVGGKYLDEVNAVYWGHGAIPLGFDNTSFARAVKCQPKIGSGQRFEAFIIASICPTLKKCPKTTLKKRPKTTL